MNNSKQIKMGAVLSYLSIAVNILAGLIYTPWMIQQIGQSQYGLYTLANSLITLFLVDFGLSSATARYLSKYHAEGDEEKVNNFLGVIYKLYLIIDAVIFTVLLVIFFLIDRIYVKLTPTELEQFKVVYVIASSFAVFNFPFVTQNGIMTAYEKFVPLKLADLIYRLLIVGLTVIALLLGFGLYALVAVHAIAGLVIILFKFIVIKKSVPIKANFRYSDKSLYKDIFGFSVWVTVASLAQRLIFNITPSILGITTDTTAISIFGVVSIIEGYVYTITTAISGMFMPKISRIYATNSEKETEKGDINSLFLNVGRFQYALNGLIIAGFAVLGQTFISLWMGAGYEEAYWGILLIIIPGLFFNSLQIANTALVVQNKVKIQAYVALITGVVNVILSIILSYFFGVVGSCISIFVAYLIRAILTNIITAKVLKFDIKPFITGCYCKMTVPIIITVIGGIILNRLIVENSWGILLLKGGIAVVIYLISIILFGLKENEFKQIIERVKGVIWSKNK